MNESTLSHLVEPLRELLGQYADIIRGHRARHGAAVIGLACDCLPPEVAGAAGITALRVPSFIAGHCACEGIAAAGVPAGAYDLLVAPRGCTGMAHLAGAGVPVHELPSPTGWGEDAAGMMGEALDGLLRAAGGGGLRGLDPARLREATAAHNALRRVVRGIAAVRRGKPGLLSCRDLAAVHEAAAVLPPESVADHLAAILDAMNRAGEGADPALPALVYCSFPGDGSLLDDIEEAGCVIVEDDSCGGRFPFDMSYDADSPRLLDEILDAFSYRPRCPSVRTVEERIDLLYRMMKGQGIELAIFVEDRCCPARRRDITRLRDHLMRSGVDPLVANAADAAAAVRDYVRRCGAR